jgi:hypothetical protein
LARGAGDDNVGGRHTGKDVGGIDLLEVCILPGQHHWWFFRLQVSEVGPEGLSGRLVDVHGGLDPASGSVEAQRETAGSAE